MVLQVTTNQSYRIQAINNGRIPKISVIVGKYGRGNGKPSIAVQKLVICQLPHKRPVLVPLHLWYIESHNRLKSMHSGDTDAVVPVTATRYSIDALKLPTLVNWYPWYDNGKVSGTHFHNSSVRIQNLIRPIIFDMLSVITGGRLEPSI